MRIGVVSDTHGNIDMLKQAVGLLTRKQKIAMLCHLGDEYDDISGLDDLYIELLQVPGIYDGRYKNGSLPAKLSEMVLGFSLLILHSLDKDLTDEDENRSDIILYGHTHRAELKLNEGRLYMNPGHLKGPLDKNMPPSFGLLVLGDRNVSASIFGLDGKTLHTMELVRSESGLYKI
ncbi:MAG: metallophosphoesterase family protein [Chitinispirillaceae bacterium]|nr:metallophosphoesterase family protein [Chitinispirillaceae bacterium]